MKLYEITAELRRLADEVEASELSETSESVLDSFRERLDKLLLTRDQKIQNIYCLLKEWKREAEAIAEEKKFLTARQRAVENRVERLKAYLAENLEIGEKWKGAVGSIYWQTSESVEATDINLVPDIYVKKELASKRELLTDIKNGAKVAGVEVVTSTHIVVR